MLLVLVSNGLILLKKKSWSRNFSEEHIEQTAVEYVLPLSGVRMRSTSI